MNLIFALIWVVVGGFLLAMPWLDPDGRIKKALVIPHESLTSVGVLAFFLAFYNVVRWYFSSAAVADRRAIGASLNRRRATRDDNAPSPQRAIDPNFDFSGPPPQPAAKPGEQGP